MQQWAPPLQLSAAPVNDSFQVQGSAQHIKLLALEHHPWRCGDALLSGCCTAAAFALPCLQPLTANTTRKQAYHVCMLYSCNAAPCAGLRTQRCAPTNQQSNQPWHHKAAKLMQQDDDAPAVCVTKEERGLCRATTSHAGQEEYSGYCSQHKQVSDLQPHCP